MRRAVDSTTKYTVPTLKMRKGDFSEVLTTATVTTADGVKTSDKTRSTNLGRNVRIPGLTERVT